jgi:sugar O-acyltransferase (sialic acid O-acetyltransferase NeuD family)
MAETTIIVIGGKGTAINVAEQIEDARERFGRQVRCLGIAIDDPALGSSVAGFPVLSGTRELWATYRESDVRFLFCLYRPDVLAERFRLLASFGIPDERFATFVHPGAYVSPSAVVGPGSVVLCGASIQNRAAVGRHCILNAGVVIEHEATVQDGCFIAAHACVGARVTLGPSVFVGLAAAIREDVCVQHGAFIGMSSTVLRGVDAGSLVYGSPARPRR